MSPLPRRLASFALAAALAVTVVGCSRDDQDGLNLGNGTSAAATGSPSPAASASSESTPAATANRAHAEVLAQYRAFYQAVARAGDDPRVGRELARVKQLLRPVATGDQFDKTVSGIYAGGRLGQRTFGEVVLHPRIVKLTDSIAVVHDCRDTSRRGREDRDGKVLTLGLKQAPAKTRMERGPDGVWRVAATNSDVDPAVFC